MSLFLALMLYPEVQKRAQEELDRVCNGRLPDFSDRPLLPYVDAVCTEISRWGVVAPLGELYRTMSSEYDILIVSSSTGVPHVASQDDVYNGYHIPAGSVLIGPSIDIGVAFSYLHLISP